MNEEKETVVQKAKVDLEARKRGNSFVLIGTSGTVGEITYQFVDVDTWIIDSTYIDPEHRGQNLGRQLLDFVVEEAREKGRKIIPSCSYVLEQFKRYPEYADVWEQSGANYSDPYSSKTMDSPGH
ncbi:GNAT family N-acetyltransferase [Paenibacillus eucommiae]|uniref:GNAT family acetyltransferase n=1 Tax=Paenibacillus eucommiae TaxID=1355755 RepID=A0ABS4J4D3_9BACL|nr:GNAT family N-acetyltransferase [Paenibacillus eucommiae]MBP1994096.1 putative GNAT family acetyltransferase [Paenibacillus eucommiae]